MHIRGLLSSCYRPLV